MIDINNLSLFIKDLNTNRKLNIYRKFSRLDLNYAEEISDGLGKRNDYDLEKSFVKKERFLNNNRFN